MTAKTRITVLVEDTAHGPGVLAEHGLSYWIEHGGRRVLFDTGQSGLLLSNAAKLGVALDRLDAAVFSHGHYDHTGGAADALQAHRTTRVFIHPAAFAGKYARNANGATRAIGMPDASRQTIQNDGRPLVATTQPTVVVEGLAVTGPVPRLTDFEDTGGSFFLDKNAATPDPITDDQSLFFATKQGTVVVLGCAHSGVINTLRYIRRLTDERPICCVLGGMHLINASESRIQQTVAEFERLGVERFAPCHCTGMAATAAIWNAFPGRCQACTVGTQFEFEI